MAVTTVSSKRSAFERTVVPDARTGTGMPANRSTRRTPGGAGTSYLDFANLQAKRRKVSFVGANDGDGPQEMWAAYAAERAGALDGRFGCVTPDEAVRSHELFAAGLESHRTHAAVSV